MLPALVVSVVAEGAKPVTPPAGTDVAMMVDVYKRQDQIGSAFAAARIIPVAKSAINAENHFPTIGLSGVNLTGWIRGGHFEDRRGRRLRRRSFLAGRADG